MTDASDTKFTIFELYLATAEKVTDRRALANSWMLSVNSAIVALYGYLQSDKIGARSKGNMVMGYSGGRCDCLCCLDGAPFILPETWQRQICCNCRT